MNGSYLFLDLLHRRGFSEFGSLARDVHIWARSLLARANSGHVRLRTGSKICTDLIANGIDVFSGLHTLAMISVTPRGIGLLCAKFGLSGSKTRRETLGMVRRVAKNQQISFYVLGQRSGGQQV